MKKLLGLIFLFHLNSVAQLKTYRLKQFQVSIDSMKNFFSKTGINSTNDTVCAIFLIPGSCPRCEGTLEPFIKYLKKQSSKIDIVLFTFSNNNSASIDYVKKLRLSTSKNLFLPKKVLYEHFLVSTTRMMTPFVLLFNTQTGMMLNSEGMLGYTVDENNVHRFLSDRKSINELIENGSRTKPVLFNPIDGYDNTFKINLEETIRINQKNFHMADATFFDVYTPSLFKFTDGLTHEIYIYKSSTDLLTKVVPSEQEQHLFVSVNEDEFIGLKKMNIARSMYFNSQLVNDSVILISASLPNIYSPKPNSISYSNKAGLICKNLFTDSILNFTNFNFKDKVFGITHPAASFASTGDYIYVPVKKGFPSSGVDDHLLNDSIFNPFCPKFYEISPVFAIFNRQGEFITFGGKLSPPIRKAQLGYMTACPIVKKINEKYYFTSGGDGILYISDNFDLSSVKDSICLWTAEKSKANIKFEKNKVDPLEYLIQTQSKNFPFRVTDYSLKGTDLLYIIAKNEESGVYYLYKHDLKTKHISYIILDDLISSVKPGIIIDNTALYIDEKDHLSLYTISCNNEVPIILKFGVN